jgi:hypothetical protein
MIMVTPHEKHYDAHHHTGHFHRTVRQPSATVTEASMETAARVSLNITTIANRAAIGS